MKDHFPKKIILIFFFFLVEKMNFGLRYLPKHEVEHGSVRDKKVSKTKHYFKLLLIGVCRAPSYSPSYVFRNPKFEHSESQRIAIQHDVMTL